EIEEVCAVACAVQNMWITASAHRIGCYWSTGGVTFYEEAKPFFGLGEHDKLLGFLYIGMPKTDKWPEAKKTPISEKVKWVERSEERRVGKEWRCRGGRGENKEQENRRE